MARGHGTGEWVLRIYAWTRPTLSLGRNQSARGRYDLDRIRDRGLDAVRRPTGGRAILHHREVTYSVTAPHAGAGDLHESYTRISRLLVSALNAMGVGAEVAGAVRRASTPGMAPCFDEPSAGELTAGGRKLAGSAQWRADGALLNMGRSWWKTTRPLLPSWRLADSTRFPHPRRSSRRLGPCPCSLRRCRGACTACATRIRTPRS